jgi:hypothetical protein
MELVLWKLMEKYKISTNGMLYITVPSIGYSEGTVNLRL